MWYLAKEAAAVKAATATVAGTTRPPCLNTAPPAPAPLAAIAPGPPAPLPAECNGWSYKTQPGEVERGVNPHVETAKCLKCLPLPLPAGLQCVADRPPKEIRKSEAQLRSIDPEELVRQLLRKVKLCRALARAHTMKIAFYA